MLDRVVSRPNRTHAPSQIVADGEGSSGTGAQTLRRSGRARPGWWWLTASLACVCCLMAFQAMAYHVWRADILGGEEADRHVHFVYLFLFVTLGIGRVVRALLEPGEAG